MIKRSTKAKLAWMSMASVPIVVALVYGTLGYALAVWFAWFLLGQHWTNVYHESKD